jgi:hypothetical protein
VALPQKMKWLFWEVDFDDLDVRQDADYVLGRAIAWHLGHRISRDLDLFSLDEKVDLEAIRRRAEADPIRAEVLSDNPTS